MAEGPFETCYAPYSHAFSLQSPIAPSLLFVEFSHAVSSSTELHVYKRRLKRSWRQEASLEYSGMAVE